MNLLHSVAHVVQLFDFASDDPVVMVVVVGSVMSGVVVWTAIVRSWSLTSTPVRIMVPVLGSFFVFPLRMKGKG